MKCEELNEEDRKQMAKAVRNLLDQLVKDTPEKEDNKTSYALSILFAAMAYICHQTMDYEDQKDFIKNISDIFENYFDKYEKDGEK